MDGITDKVVIITGASSGIGQATAEVLAAKGAKLMLAARRKDRLEALAAKLGADNAAVCETDVTDHAQLLALAAATIERFGRIDVLVNNAGVMPLSFISSRKVEEWDRMIDVNIKGVLYGIDAVLPHMLERESGHIINVASVAGHSVTKVSSVYSGTKFAVRAISEGLRQELSGKIRVTIISPGAVETELLESITEASIAKRLEKGFGFEILPPESIGDAIAYAIAQPAGTSVNEILIRPTGQG